MPHTSKPSAPSTQAAPSELTAPRKPVAFVDPKHLGWLHDGSASMRKTGVRLNLSRDPTLARTQALYTETNLQPLWALVETWEKDGAECRAVATDQEEQGYGEGAECNYSQAWRFEECAAALRQLLEAMQ